MKSAIWLFCICALAALVFIIGTAHGQTQKVEETKVDPCEWALDKAKFYALAAEESNTFGQTYEAPMAKAQVSIAYSNYYQACRSRYK